MLSLGSFIAACGCDLSISGDHRGRIWMEALGRRAASVRVENERVAIFRQFSIALMGSLIGVTRRYLVLFDCPLCFAGLPSHV